jgi:flagellar hook-basal body complex protein FliE
MAIMPIIPISPIGEAVRINGIGSIGSVTGAAPTGGSSFASMLAEQLDAVSAAQNKADSLALKAATGDLESIQDFTIASTEAQLLTQLTVNVRNRAVEAFNDIMRMQG